MHQFPDHGINDPDIRTGEYQRLPTAEAVLAGTLALMTGYAQGCCNDHRTRMAEKIIANLAILSSHPQASSGFQAMTANLQVMWVRLLQPPQPQPLPEALQSGRSTVWPAQDAVRYSESAPNRVLWNASPETVQ